MKKRILSVLITLVMLIGLVTVMSVSASAADATSEIHWAVVQKDSDVILYLGNAAHVMETGETLYADNAQGIDDMVLEYYFNQPYEDWYTEITKVVVESEIQPASCAYWFYDLFRCTEMDLRLLNTGSVTSMKAMFKYCSSMTTLTWDTSKFTTANVTTMESMFYNCEKLTSLDLSHFDTSNVTNMLDMFYRCTKLETLDLSSFDTSDVTDMAFMFYACYELAYLDLSNFDLSSIADSSSKSLFSFAEILTLKTPKINPYADAFGFTYTYSDEQGNLYTALPVSESAEGVKTLYKNSSIYYYLDGATGGEGSPTRYAYDKAYSITLTAPQRAGFIFDGWKVDEGPEGVTVVGNTLTIPQYTTGTVYIDALWKPYTVSVSGSFAPYTATIDPLRDDVTYSWHEYSFGSNEITDESAIYISEYLSGTYDAETGWTPSQFEALYIFFEVSLKSGDTVTVTFADDVDVEYAVLMDSEWEPIFGEAQADNVILFTIPKDEIYTLMTDGIDTTAKAIHTGESVSNTAAFTGATFSTGEIGTQYVAKATFTDGGEEVIAYSDLFTYAEHIVTFDYGTLGSETKTVLNGETVTPPAPVFAGKVLVGWYADSNFTTEFNFSDAITADKTIYAKFADYEGDKAELNDAIDALETAVDNVKTALDNKVGTDKLTEEIGKLNQAIAEAKAYADTQDAALKTTLEAADATMNAAITELQNRVTALETGLTTANGNINTNTGDITALKTDVSDLKAWKTEAQNAIIALQNLTNTQDTNISALQTAVADLQTAVSTANSNIAAAEARIAVLEGKVSALETAKQELEDAVSALQTAVAGKADTATVNAAIAGLQTAIEALEAVKNNYIGADDALRTELEGKIANAQTAAISAAEALVNNAKAELQSKIDAKADAATVNEAIANLQNAITALEAAKDNYASADAALKLELEDAIVKAKAEAIEASKGYIPHIGTNGNWWIGDTDTGVDANGIKGDTGATGAPGAQGPQGEKGDKGDTGAQGADGVGIAKIEKTSSDGNVDTYTITLTNGTTYTFTVTNGTNGTDGKDGKDGKDGVDGKDGTNGTNGVDGKDGTDGEDGQTPYIGENGNWWIGDTDTGVKAAGDDGKDGAIIVSTAVGGTALISNIALIAWTLIKKKRLF